jgi:hypothetical protein
MTIPFSDLLTGIGLILNIVGVYFLTLTDLFTSKPIHMWWFYIRHVDRNNPEETEKEPPVETISPVGGGLGTVAIPSSPEKYDRVKAMMRNQSIAAIGLIGGFICQFGALLVS